MDKANSTVATAGENASLPEVRPPRLPGFHEIGSILERTVIEWNTDDAQRLGASLAFYAVFSLAPLVIVTVAVAGAVFGNQAAASKLTHEVQIFIGDDAAQMVQLVLKAAHKPVAGTIATLLSCATVIFGASSVGVELQEALNTIWRVPKPASITLVGRIVGFMKERFLAFLLVLAGGLLLVLSLMLSAFIAAMGHFLNEFLLTSELWLHLDAFAGSFILASLVFALVYKLLPTVPLRWKDVMLGSTVTAFFFTTGKQFLALYLGKVGFESVYGAAGSVVLILAWVYYSSQLFFLGAEFTKVYARTRGAHKGADRQRG